MGGLFSIPAGRPSLAVVCKLQIVSPIVRKHCGQECEDVQRWWGMPRWINEGLKILIWKFSVDIGSVEPKQFRLVDQVNMNLQWNFYLFCVFFLLY